MTKDTFINAWSRELSGDREHHKKEIWDIITDHSISTDRGPDGYDHLLDDENLEAAIEDVLDLVPLKSLQVEPNPIRCKYVKREGESCTAGNNCTYPDCPQVEPEVSEEYIRDKIAIIVDSTRFHDVRIEHILQQKVALTDELVKAFHELIESHNSDYPEVDGVSEEIGEGAAKIGMDKRMGIISGFKLADSDDIESHNSDSDGKRKGGISEIHRMGEAYSKEFLGDAYKKDGLREIAIELGYVEGFLVAKRLPL